MQADCLHLIQRAFDLMRGCKTGASASERVFGGLLPKTRQAGTTGPSSASPVLASRKILVEEPHFPAATNLPASPSARFSHNSRAAIDSRSSFAFPAIGHARRALVISRNQ